MVGTRVVNASLAQVRQNAAGVLGSLAAGVSGVLPTNDLKSLAGLPTSASVIGAVMQAADLDGNIEWSPLASALLPDVRPVAGTLMYYDGNRTFGYGGAVSHAGSMTLGGNLTCGAITAGGTVATNTVGNSSGALSVMAHGINRFAFGAAGGNNLQFRSDGSISFATATTIGGASDAAIGRASAGKLSLQGDAGLQVRNFANSADAPITCGAITSGAAGTSNGQLVVGAATSVNAKIQIVGNANLVASGNCNALGTTWAIVTDTTGSGGPAALRFGSTGTIAFGDTAANLGTMDVVLGRSSANTLGVYTTEAKSTLANVSAAAIAASGHLTVSGGSSAAMLETLDTGAYSAASGQGAVRITARSPHAQVIELDPRGTDGSGLMHGVARMMCGTTLKIRNLTNTTDQAIATAAVTATDDVTISGTSKGIVFTDGTLAATLRHETHQGQARFASNNYARFGVLSVGYNANGQSAFIGGIGGWANNLVVGPGYGMQWSSLTSGEPWTLQAAVDLSIHRKSSGAAEINSGTRGSYRDLFLRDLTASGNLAWTPTQSSLDPTTTDIPSGRRVSWYNSTLGEFRDWVNIGGTLLKSAAYT